MNSLRAGRTGGLVLKLVVALHSPAALADDRDCSAWPAWDSFRTRFMQDDGRVIDHSSPRVHSTSEGQAYALFFALVANDAASFAPILRWTEDNLAGGDLTARLPAWQWGKRDDGVWGVMDDNAAADADLWIAYVLAEAGRLWKNPKYLVLAKLLAARILREETAELPGLGRTLIPGPRGFHPQPDLWRLNPSYTPPQLLRRMSHLYAGAEWKRLVSSSVKVLIHSSPRGFAPDWVLYKAGAGFQPDQQTKAVGSYNAIRIYLWAGMLAADDSIRPVLIKRLAGMARHVVAQRTPPLEVNTVEGLAAGAGPPAFSAALLPFLSASKLPESFNLQRLRTDASASLERCDNYYEPALILFGVGHAERRYRFGRDGSLAPRWTCVPR